MGVFFYIFYDIIPVSENMGHIMKSQDILNIIDKYIEKYGSEKNPEYETIYRLENSDAAAMGPDFIRDDASRVFFCFYRLTPEQYDNGGAQSFADAAFMGGDSLRDDKIKLELNVNMPVRVDKNGITIDRAMMAEIISHELMHAYRNRAELTAGHYKWAYPLLDFIKQKFSDRKYTMTMRSRAYDRTMPMPGIDSKMVERFKWVGYTMVEDEMFANLAGIETFLSAGGDIKHSRGKMLADIVDWHLTYIEQNATDDDWRKCMKDISYIPPRKDESVGRFKRRWVSYYRDRLARFYEKMEKLCDKYSRGKVKAKFKSGANKVVVKSIISMNAQSHLHE